MLSFFSGLRGKLILTYTLVTVLALMALEVLVLGAASVLFGLSHSDQRQYLNDVIYTLYPQASTYLQPGKEDLVGLQAWLDGVAASGYASLEPQYAFDSPAAAIVPGMPLLVLSPDRTILAQAPRGPGDLVGRRYTAAPGAEVERILENALLGNLSTPALSTTTEDGYTQLAVPILETDKASPPVGALLVTLEPARRSSSPCCRLTCAGSC